MLKINYFFFVLCFSSITISQNIGVRFGITTATITGNNDSYDFDFINSLSPGYQASMLGRFVLSDVIIFKPELSYRQYTLKQKDNFDIYPNVQVDQKYIVVSSDFNFDIELSNSSSCIFGMGLDYLMKKKQTIFFPDIEEEYIYNLKNNPIDSRFDPFAIIGFCYKINSNILLDIQYRHLLDNWGTVDDESTSHIVNSSNGSVKLHMINLSTAILF